MTNHVAAARRLIEAGRTDLAARELRDAIARDPEDGTAHGLLSLCLTNDGHHPQALAASDAALRLVPEDAFAWRVRTVIFVNLHRSDDARDAAEQAIRLDPQHSQSFVVRGQARLLAGLYESALADLDTALSLDPSAAYTHDVRARALTLMGRNEDAAEAAREALRLAPESATAHATRGLQLLHAGDREAAQAEYREALRLDPQSNWARLGLIEALKARNPVYRRVLRGLLLLQRSAGRAVSDGPRFNWAPFIIALFLVGIFQGVSSSLAVRPLFIAGVVLVYAAIVVAWAARPLFNGVLLLTADGRHLLTPEERREGTLVAACLATAVTMGVLWALTDGRAFALAGVSMTVLSYLVVAATVCTRAWRRWLLWVLGSTSVGVMLAGVAASVASYGGALPDGSPVGLMVLAPGFATAASMVVGRSRRSRGLVKLPSLRGTPHLNRSHTEPTAPARRWLAWPLLAFGLMAGMGLLGSLHGGARLGGGALCATAFAAAVVLPAVRPVVRRARASSGRPALILLAALATAALGSGAAAVATRRVPIEGGFVLALLLLAACALVLGADTPARRRRLTAWVAACALLVVACGAAALLGGRTHGPDSALTGPLATWAGAGLFGLLLTPLLARVRRPRRLIARP